MRGNPSLAVLQAVHNHLCGRSPSDAEIDLVFRYAAEQLLKPPEGRPGGEWWLLIAWIEDKRKEAGYTRDEAFGWALSSGEVPEDVWPVKSREERERRLPTAHKNHRKNALEYWNWAETELGECINLTAMIREKLHGADWSAGDYLPEGKDPD